MTSNDLSNTERTIALLTNEKDSILEEWVDLIRKEFSDTAARSDVELEDHFAMVLKHLIDELKVYAKQEEAYDIYERFGKTNQGQRGDNDGAEIHGRQRASLNAYNVEKVYREYVFLRNILIARIKRCMLLNTDILEIITSVVEHSTQQSLRSFTESVQEIQRRILGALVHDIRGPLSVISLNCHITASDPNAESIQTRQPQVNRALDRVSTMLEDMLQTISIEGGQGLDLTFEETDILKHIDKLVADITTAYGNTFNYTAPSDRVMMVCDPDAIVRGIENLLLNAFKFGDQSKGISLSIDVDDESVVFLIHNCGSVISKDRQREIFEYFASFSDSEKKKTKSWGIGLAIAKAISEGHSGKISVSSDEKSGTTFIISIPKNRQTAGSKLNVTI